MNDIFKELTATKATSIAADLSKITLKLKGVFSPCFHEFLSLS
jgi:hypothetical protein